MAKKDDNTLWYIALVVGFFLLKNKKTSSQNPKRQELINYLISTNEDSSVVQIMTDEEIESVYTYVFQYVLPDISIDENSILAEDIRIIGLKYNIFT